jgi:HPt (histidine-containing phosphotransfer) domain-containing protein
MKIEIPGLNVESGLNVCGGDLNIYLYSLRLYISNMPALMEKMRVISEDTLRSYSICVHSIKGMSEYIGAEEVKATAKQLELMAKESNLAEIQEKNEAFILNLDKLTNDIQSWLKENSDKAII